MNPLPRKARDKLLRRTDILRAATHVFAEKGYHDATMLDIARQAEYAVGTIYLYFRDKQALYLALSEEKIEELFCRIKDKMGEAQGSLAKIKVLVEEQLAYFEENEDFFRIYFSEEGFGSRLVTDKPSRQMMERIVKFRGYLITVIKKAQAENVLRADLDPNRAARLLGGMIKSIIIPWLKDKTLKEKDLKGSSGFILDIFLNGAASPSAKNRDALCN